MSSKARNKKPSTAMTVAKDCLAPPDALAVTWQKRLGKKHGALLLDEKSTDLTIVFPEEAGNGGVWYITQEGAWHVSAVTIHPDRTVSVHMDDGVCEPLLSATEGSKTTSSAVISGGKRRRKKDTQSQKPSVVTVES